MKTSKPYFFFMALLLSISAVGQIQVDKQIQLTSTGNNAKIEGVDEVVNNHDAANKIYVDTAIANRTGGSASDMVISLTAATNTATTSPGNTTLGNPIVLTVAAVSGTTFGPVYFQVSGAPPGINCNFSAVGGYPTFITNLYFIVSGSVSPGTYPVTVTAIGGSGSQSVNVSVTVVAGKRVFLSSTATTGNFGGVSQGDNICQNLANAKSLGGTWKAWLADGGSGPSSSFNVSSDPYFLMNGVILVNNWSDLTDGNLSRNFDVDESGTTVTSNLRVWSNVAANGSRLDATNHCSNWTSTSGSGRTGVADRYWNSDWTGDNGYGCSTSLRFYCFEQ